MSSPLRAQFPQGKKGEGRLLRGRGWNHGGSCGVRWRKSRGLEFDLEFEYWGLSLLGCV